MEAGAENNPHPSRWLARPTSDGIVTIGSDGMVAFANWAICSALQVSSEEIVGTSLLTRLHPDDADRFNEFRLASGLQIESGPIDLRLQASDGSTVWFQGSRINLMDDDVVRGIVWHLRNISEARAAETTVARNEALIQALATQAPDVTFVIDRDGRISYVSHSIHHAFGFTQAEVEGMLASELGERVVHVDDRHLLGVYDMFAAPAGDKGAMRYRVLRPDGAWHWAEASYHNLLHDPAVDGLVVNMRDVGEQHIAGLALAESEARYRTIVETAAEGIWMFDSDGISTFANPKLAALLGYTVDELIGVRYRAYLANEHELAVADAQWANRASGFGEFSETILRSADGSEIEVRVSGSLLTNAAGEMTGSLVMITDLTRERQIERERAHLREQREQDQRLASLGQLAGGIAHDFNNLLGIIVYYARLAEQEVTSQQAIEDIGHIRQASERAATLTTQLLAFARRQVVTPELVAVNDLVSEFTKMLRRTLGGHVDLQVYLEHGLVEPVVSFDPHQLELVLLNLALNARDAMPDGGTVTIETAVRVNSAVLSDSLVTIRVSDDGVGMDPGVAARAFEPFFTTKGHGAGTGLGLATVHGLVAQAGGRVAIESAPAAGTTIEILLPLRQPADTAGQPVARAASGTALSGAERILVVDDEPALRRATSRILRLHGYDVVEAAGGAAALALLDASGKHVDLVLTDISMKRMSGRELAAEIGRRDAALPVLYVTGYDDSDISEASGRVLYKPVAEETLLEAIRTELDRAQPE